MRPLFICLTVLWLSVGISRAGAFSLPIVLEEHLGHVWGSAPFHRTIDLPTAGVLFPDKVVLLNGTAAIPLQLCNAETYADGSLKHADIWFTTDLPAHGTRTFSLQAVENAFVQPHAEIGLRRTGKMWEISNGATAVLLPAGTWTPPVEAVSPTEIAGALAKELGVPAKDGLLPGPLLGIKLPSGKWTALAGIKPAGKCLGYASEVLLPGPIITKIRLTYRFAAEGRYTADIILRAGEPMVRIDEKYVKAGEFVVDFPEIKPTTLGWEGFRPSATGKSVAISYEKPGKVGGALVGYNYVPGGIAPAYALTGDPGGALIGLVSTDTDWLPFPYSQSLEFAVRQPGMLCMQGSLASGQRHWAVFVGKEADFANRTATDQPAALPEKDMTPSEAPSPVTKAFYRWWWQHLVVPLDTVGNWRLTWPEMEKIAFPHTFFSKEDLPGIHTRLQSEPSIVKYLDGTRPGWGTLEGSAGGSKSPAVKNAFARYKANYYPNGVASTYSDVAVAYLITGDTLYLRQLGESLVLADGSESPRDYLNYVVNSALDNDCYFFEDRLSYLNMTDGFFQRMVGMELLLGSDLLTPAERKEMLSRLAFVVYLLNNPMFQPPNYPMGAGEYIGYGQGTPNMKHCLIAVRGMLACMLSNHPDRKQWMDYTLEEYERNIPYSVNSNGVHLESPFYSSRDTMRFGPFWLAMTRAGVSGAIVQKWLNRTKLTYQYLGDMLTPPEPRMGGRRVYQPIGRSSSGVIDPTFIAGVDPWGDTDEAHGRLMRWLWEAEGKPAPNFSGTAGGRDMSLTLLAYSKLLKFKPCETPPLTDKRWEGMGAIFRSQVGTGYESNILFRHDQYCWDLYPVNNGGVYFYGKGAPLCPRFGGYWMGQQGQCDMMTEPFGNRVFFSQGSNYSIGAMTEYASLGKLADMAVGVTGEKDWTRSVLFAKDLDRDDPVYLLVRDDVSRAEAKSYLHWWVMSKDVQPNGLEKPGVVPTRNTDAQWYANLGKNWANALKAGAGAPPPEDPDHATEAPAGTPVVPTPPVLKGQVQHFTGQCGVDVDLFIAQPVDPVILTDAAGVGPGLSYCVNQKLFEYQQLVRIEQPAGKPFLTLLTPRWPGSVAPSYRTIAGGAGVAISQPNREDRLFLSTVAVTYQDTLVTFTGRLGFVRKGGASPLRLMVANGRISADGITLTSEQPAALCYDGTKILLYGAKGITPAAVQLAPEMKKVPVTLVSGE